MTTIQEEINILLQVNKPSTTSISTVGLLCAQILPRKSVNLLRGACVEMEDLKTPLTRSIVNTKSVINVLRRGTPPHISIRKSINSRRIVTNPVVPVIMSATMPAVPVYRENKAL